jgi:sarcosine oxidase subunit alpha
MQSNRLPTGGRIDRNRPLQFRFNGRVLEGYAGDTLASALIANDVSIVGRSFKYHRPRGIIGSGAEEPNAIVQLGSGATAEPGLRATQVELYDGLQAGSVKGWPGVNFDIGVVNDWMGRALGAGFYYKTFMRPAKLWRLYEYFIRRSAGLGTAPTLRDPDAYSHCNAHCDVLVAGAGPAGLAAALEAANSGARVIIADEQNEFGGSLLASRETIDGLPAAEWIAIQCQALANSNNVTVLSRSSVFGYYDYNFLGILEHCAAQHDGKGKIRQRLWRVRAKHVVLAQGAFERPLVFCNNDRPGIMLASAVSASINRYAVLPGRRAVVFTNNDSAYQSALDLNEAGADVRCVIDSRPRGAGPITDKLRAAAIPLKCGSVITNAFGRKRIRGVEVQTLDVSHREIIECDLLTMSGGWSPAVHLHSQAGGAIRWDDVRHCFVPSKPAQPNRSVGACNGTWDIAGCLREGREAGVEAARKSGRRTVTVTKAETEAANDAANENATEALWRVPGRRDAERLPKQFVDYQNDTTVSDIRLAVREGYTGIEHVKRYTALGFGTDQGKLGNINGMAILAECLGRPLEAIGTTTFRPPYTPIRFGACAGVGIGPLYDPVRKTAMHGWHERQQAQFEPVGQWLRPAYFPLGEEDLDAAVRRECLATRRSVGIMDASTLGKIDVRGPDACEFMERIYTHNVSKMPVGRCAYGILLGEDGMIRDDGVVSRLAEQHFYVTTTTGGAANVLGWMEKWLQTEWPGLEVYLTSMTEHYSTIAVAGPNSRRLIGKLGCDLDIGRAAMPFMTFRAGHLAGRAVTLSRVSFSGELAFEINIDSSQALDLWHTLMDAGREFDITPYGTETMHVLRAEKGYVIVGQDTDGSVTPVDLGMNWLLSKDKDFLGKRSLARSDCRRPDRKQFVGLKSVNGKTVVSEGAQLVTERPKRLPAPVCGHVSSSYYSAVLEQPIALGLIRSGRSRYGEKAFAIGSNGVEVPVEIVSPVFVDPKGERQRD